MLEYWYSYAAKAWLVVDKTTGKLLAQFPDIAFIERYFQPDIITHNNEQCDYTVPQ
jgi:hypothetical protein